MSQRILVVCACALLSCGLRYKSLPGHYGADFLSICIDSTLRLDSGTSTPSYLVDLSNLENWPDSVIREFYATNRSARPTNLDSLQRNDSTWLKYGFFPMTVVLFKSLEERNDSIIVTTSKIKASDGSNGAKMIFKRKGSSYKCLYSGITWIS